MAKPVLLAADLGTYCDFLWMETALVPLSEHYDIHFITNLGRTLPSWVKGVYTVKTPEWALKDINFPILTSDKSAYKSLIESPTKSREGYLWMLAYKHMLNRVAMLTSPKGIFLHYGLISLLFVLEKEVAHIPMFVLYYVPELPNKTYPHVFDSLVKDSRFRLYSETKDYKEIVKKSWLHWAHVFSWFTVTSFPDLRTVLKRAEHIYCWDSQITPLIQPLFSKESVHIHHLGSIYDERKLGVKHWYNPTNKAEHSPPIAIQRFMSHSRPLVLVSFGSYVLEKEVMNLLKVLISLVIDCGYNVLFHAAVKLDLLENLKKLIPDSPFVHTHHGWIPYEWIVPKCSRVMFTGSVCLQTICLYNQIPMIFVPMLAEQFFWARNYQAMTESTAKTTKGLVQPGGVPFINYKESLPLQTSCLIRALLGEFPGVSNYLERVSSHMKKHDGKQQLKHLIRRLC